MFSGDLLALFIGGGDQSAASEVVGSSKQAAGALLDSGDGLGREELGFDSGDGQVVGEVGLHLIEVDPFKVASGDDAGRKRQRGAVLEKIHKVILAGQD